MLLYIVNKIFLFCKHMPITVFWARVFLLLTPNFYHNIDYTIYYARDNMGHVLLLCQQDTFGLIRPTYLLK